MIYEDHRDGCKCANCWMIRNGKPLPKMLDRKERCQSIGKRIEFMVGCNGMRCKWECSQGLIAIPATTCQRCELYVAEDSVNWLGYSVAKVD
jgi:hypothetical protein